MFSLPDLKSATDSKSTAVDPKKPLYSAADLAKVLEDVKVSVQLDVGISRLQLFMTWINY